MSLLFLVSERAVNSRESRPHGSHQELGEDKIANETRGKDVVDNRQASERRGGGGSDGDMAMAMANAKEGELVQGGGEKDREITLAPTEPATSSSLVLNSSGRQLHILC